MGWVECKRGLGFLYQSFGLLLDVWQLGMRALCGCFYASGAMMFTLASNLSTLESHTILLEIQLYLKACFKLHTSHQHSLSANNGVSQSFKLRAAWLYLLNEGS